jgi:hypothetical protein
MSRFHGEQCWSEIRHQAKHAWRELTEDDLDIMEAVQREREVRTRDQRSRVRRSHRLEEREADI